MSHNKAEVRDEKGRFVVPPKSPGRPVKTKEERIIEKSVKKWLEEYEGDLAEALPTIKPSLIQAAKEKQGWAFAEIHKVLGAHKASGNTIVPIQINFGEDRAKYSE